MRLGPDAAAGSLFDGGASDDSPEALLGGLLLGVTRRHSKLLLGWFKGAAAGSDAAGAGGGDAAAAAAVAEMCQAVERASNGGDKLRAYLQLLLAVIKHQIAAAVALLTAPDGSATESGAEDLEGALVRLEDCALIMMHQAGYLAQAPSLDMQLELVRRLPSSRRVAAIGRQLATFRQYDTYTVKHLAAVVVQTCWRRHRRARRAAAAARAKETGERAAAAAAGGGAGAGAVALAVGEPAMALP
ncbi:hypothetical protein GPECTOR_4g855 [Gonium pectorale]|uniref:Uncharacterized protein n=1 Tax=Gonium pectorale TaxID=33097 RepID=A0A150GYB4_GONPE|nr:hypothetical protein GPECTOR_4g855 [Gonium pectorale]|eukprot:KXZ54784.1 hypothetical protein GPECTOR_4g855 [Gonium pectorale]